jgi:copper homeostasis protein
MSSLPTPPRLLEICVDTLEAALAAERGGADRIELCANLPVGGVSPSVEMMQQARRAIHLPIFVMIRPHGRNFVCSDDEFAGMKHSIQIAKESGMDGVVLGILKNSFQVDVERTRMLVEFAHPLPVTFHRAFDECHNLPNALEEVIRSGATRLLSSGARPTAPEATHILKSLMNQAGQRITVMPGGGIHSGNIADVAAKTGAREFHAGLSSVVPRESKNFMQLFEREVRKFSAQIKKIV